MQTNTERMLAALLTLTAITGGAYGASSSSDGQTAQETVIAHLKTKLLVRNTHDHDCFGRSVALDGDYLIAGAKGDDEMGNNSGAAYIFHRSGDVWIEEAKLKAADAGINDFFGFSVGIQGATVVVGAWQNGEKGLGSGAAYVFERRGASWVQTAKLLGSDQGPFAQFGYTVGINGETIVVGARQGQNVSGPAGSAYIFRKDGASWTQEAKLQNPNLRQNATFGWSVAASPGRVIVGAVGNDSPGATGAAYVFRHEGSNWVLESTLTGDNKPADKFGYSVALNGGTAVVGAYRDDQAGFESGTAYVFGRKGNSWKREARLVAAQARSHELFGWSVGVSGDTVAVGSWYDDQGKDGPLGSAYVYKHRGGAWVPAQKMVAANRNPLELFGWAVAVSGKTVVVGARLDNQAALQGGAVYVGDADFGSH